MKIKVLLSSYNGKQYLQEQLDSVLSQTQPGVEIIARDDGSTDGTVGILESYRMKGLLNYYTGENIGFSKSFWWLLCNSGDADYYAFCDQDDIWDRDKLETAVKALEKQNKALPALYFSDVRVVDSQLNMISPHMVNVIPNDYPHSLIRNIAPGCTYVFNHSAAEILRKYDPNISGIDYHDWTAYRITACFGHVIFDKEPHISYRQHNGNFVGTNTDLKAYFKKIGAFLYGNMACSRQCAAHRLLNTYGREMSSENHRITELFSKIQSSLQARVQLVFSKSLYFHGPQRFLMNILILIGRF